MYLHLHVHVACNNIALMHITMSKFMTRKLSQTQGRYCRQINREGPTSQIRLILPTPYTLYMCLHEKLELNGAIMSQRQQSNCSLVVDLNNSQDFQCTIFRVQTTYKSLQIFHPQSSADDGNFMTVFCILLYGEICCRRPLNILRSFVRTYTSIPIQHPLSYYSFPICGSRWSPSYSSQDPSVPSLLQMSFLFLLQLPIYSKSHPTGNQCCIQNYV